MDPLFVVHFEENRDSSVAAAAVPAPHHRGLQAVAKKDICLAKSLPLTLLPGTADEGDPPAAAAAATSKEASSERGSKAAQLEVKKEDLRQRRRRQLRYNHQVTMELDLDRANGHR